MKVKYKTILMIAFVGILVCGIEISAKEKRVGAFQFSYVTLDGAQCTNNKNYTYTGNDS